MKLVLKTTAALSLIAAIGYSLNFLFPAQSKNLILHEGFEGGNHKQLGAHEGCCHAVVTTPTRAGRHSYRSTLGSPAKTDRPERAEIKLKPFPVDSERWVGISIFIPSGADKGSTSLFQFVRKPGGAVNRYAAAFQLESEKGQFKIIRRGAGSTGKRGDNQTWNLGAITYDKWTDIVFHYKGATTSNGLFEVWVNGARKMKYQGITEERRRQGPYLKLGIYVGIGNKIGKETSIFYDELRVGDEHASYKDVAPTTIKRPEVAVRSSE